MNKNYTKLEKHQGIYKNKKTGRYLGVKKIYGVQYSESFDKVRDAIHWRRTFNGTTQPPVKKSLKPEPPRVKNCHEDDTDPRGGMGVDAQVALSDFGCWYD